MQDSETDLHDTPDLYIAVLITKEPGRVLAVAEVSDGSPRECPGTGASEALGQVPQPKQENLEPSSDWDTGTGLDVFCQGCRGLLLGAVSVPSVPQLCRKQHRKEVLGSWHLHVALPGCPVCQAS